MFKKILKFIKSHKIITTMLVIGIAVGGYYAYKATIGKASSQTRYTLTAVEKGVLVSSVSGAGQVVALDQADIKPKVSGDVVYLAVSNGQKVKQGDLIAQIDPTDSQKAVNDAKVALETAQLDLKELQKPLDELALLQAENGLLQLQESRQEAVENLAKSNEDGFNAAVNAFFELPAVMADLDATLYGNDISKNQGNIDGYVDMVGVYGLEEAMRYKNIAQKSYDEARKSYDQNFQDYKAISRASDSGKIQALIVETYETSKKIAGAIKDADNLIAFVKDELIQGEKNIPKVMATHQSLIKSDTSKINNAISSLSSAKSAIENSQKTIIKTERSIKEKQLSLADLKAGPDALAIRAKQLAVQQKQDALKTAEQNLADCNVRAPFSGQVAKVNVRKLDSVSSGTSIAILITNQKVAEISLNEVDAAKVKAGQKATVTLDAISDLSISGVIVEIDAIGEVAQGVVSYTARIIFDTQDERIKPEMSASASIITDVKPDVLMVANSAVKMQGEVSYVEAPGQSENKQVLITANLSGIALTVPLQRQTVEAGISNDDFTEIISGLEQGDLVITGSISSTATQNSQQSNSFRLPGITGGAGAGAGGTFRSGTVGR